MEKRIMTVFAPHPDDETLCVGGTIAKRIIEGYEVFIIVLTDGRNAFSSIFNINSNPTPIELKDMRHEELLNAAKILGVPKENLFFLDFEDGKLDENERLAEEKISSLLMKSPPTEVYFTYGKDVNPDHRSTNRIVLNAFKKTKLAAEKYQYSTRQTYSRISPMKDSFFNIFKKNLCYVDISPYIEVKKQALNEFRSQISIITKEQTRPVLSPERLSKHAQSPEVFYKVNI